MVIYWWSYPDHLGYTPSPPCLGIVPTWAQNTCWIQWIWWKNHEYGNQTHVFMNCSVFFPPDSLISEMFNSCSWTVQCFMFFSRNIYSICLEMYRNFYRLEKIHCLLKKYPRYKGKNIRDKNTDQDRKIRYLDR